MRRGCSFLAMRNADGGVENFHRWTIYRLFRFAFGVSERLGALSLRKRKVAAAPVGELMGNEPDHRDRRPERKRSAGHDEVPFDEADHDRGVSALRRASRVGAGLTIGRSMPARVQTLRLHARSC
jgi:hypothetical protein